MIFLPLKPDAKSSLRRALFSCIFRENCYDEGKNTWNRRVLDQFEYAGSHAFMAGGYGIVDVFPGKEDTLRVMVRSWAYEGPAQYSWFPLAGA